MSNTTKPSKRQLRQQLRDFIFKTAISRTKADISVKFHSSLTRKWGIDNHGFPYDISDLHHIINRRALTQFHNSLMSHVAGID